MRNNETDAWIAEIIEKYQKVDEQRGTTNGMDTAIGIFGKALVDNYLKNQKKKKRRRK